MIDPIDLRKILWSSVNWTMRKFHNVPLDRDDLMSEAEFIAVEMMPKFSREKGSVHKYIYYQVCNHLRKYINRKVMPNAWGVPGFRRINLDVSEVTYGAIEYTPSGDGKVEAREILDKLYKGGDEVDRGIMEGIRDGLTMMEVATKVGLSTRMGVYRRLRKMRERV